MSVLDECQSLISLTPDRRHGRQAPAIISLYHWGPRPAPETGGGDACATPGTAAATPPRSPHTAAILARCHPLLPHFAPRSDWTTGAPISRPSLCDWPQSLLAFPDRYRSYGIFHRRIPACLAESKKSFPFLAGTAPSPCHALLPPAHSGSLDQIAAPSSGWFPSRLCKASWASSTRPRRQVKQTRAKRYTSAVAARQTLTSLAGRGRPSLLLRFSTRAALASRKALAPTDPGSRIRPAQASARGAAVRDPPSDAAASGSSILVMLGTPCLSCTETRSFTMSSEHPWHSGIFSSQAV
ncbi:uncharacterized protein LOC121233121 [Aquila chrysaetos chrysaetos]|uniref:uncharacterized protein LOC121233121 n=1 Tax=Aquila chrysaetos chrysaetos TaxID=223781 RepID=UPI001B7D2D41|nr:uncharacterized protein LOC121233121 [Aquila chrysaetos chrysaetos]